MEVLDLSNVFDLFLPLASDCGTAAVITVYLFSATSKLDYKSHEHSKSGKTSTNSSGITQISQSVGLMV